MAVTTAFQVLLVEDDASVRESVGAALRDEGYEVKTAVDGQEAMDSFTPGTDLVIADLVMPKVDGRSLLRWVTSNHPETAVILMTGYGTIPQAVDAIKAGAAAYLTKPLDPGLPRIQRLGQVRRRAGLDRVHRLRDRPVPRHQDDRGFRMVRRDPPKQRSPVHLGHHQVRDDQVGPRRERIHRLLPVDGRLHLVPLVAQRRTDALAHRSVVFHQQNLKRRRNRHSPLRPWASRAQS